MASPGQPTLYKREYCELAHNYYLLGATNGLLGDFFSVAHRTIQNWLATRPGFATAARPKTTAGNTGNTGNSF